MALPTTVLAVPLLGMVATAVVRELRRPAATRTWTGDVAHVPYDFRRPTPARLRERTWNRDAPLLTPQVWGMGWTLNLGRLLARRRTHLS